VWKRGGSDMPLISVITVVFNGRATLEETICSVLRQTYGNVEYIVVDGGSSDGSLEIIRKYDDRIDFWISERDRGIYDAMNKGMSLASGDIVGFLNADDLYADDGVLQKISDAFQSASIQACYADLIYVSQDNSRVVRYWKSKKFVKGDFAKGWSPAHPTFYVRRSEFEHMGLFDSAYKLAADVEFMMRYLERGGLNSVYIPDVLVRMRVGGVSNRSWKNIVLQNKEVFAALRKNGIPFSKVTFIVNKFFSRLGQFIAARLLGKCKP
jgi:glycosyltransferase involved in cell wall biosynthesis